PELADAENRRQVLCGAAHRTGWLDDRCVFQDEIISGGCRGAGPCSAVYLTNRIPPPNDASPIGTRPPTCCIVFRSNVTMSFDNSFITCSVFESGENSGKPWPVSSGLIFRSATICFVATSITDTSGPWVAATK